MVARILALVAAVGLVAGAVALRGAIEGDDASAGDDARIAIWCDPLLADACTSAADGAEVEMIEPGDAFKRLADPQNDGPAPVSYTHLRAHETVLELVCRLLLAKINKSNRTTLIHLTYCTSTREDSSLTIKILTRMTHDTNSNRSHSEDH